MMEAFDATTTLAKGEPWQKQLEGCWTMLLCLKLALVPFPLSALYSRASPLYIPSLFTLFFF